MLEDAATKGNEVKDILSEIDTALAAPLRNFHFLLLKLEGRNFGSLKANQHIASLLQETADRLHIAFECTRCNQPARFRCTKNRSIKTGMFTFSHSVGTHTGTAAIPQLVIVPKPHHGLRRKEA